LTSAMQSPGQWGGDDPCSEMRKACWPGKKVNGCVSPRTVAFLPGLYSWRMQIVPNSRACPPQAKVHPEMIAACLSDCGESVTPSAMLGRLAARGLDRIPYPGCGGTLLRWQMLAAVSAHDLALAKLYEGHTDALAILAELQPDAPSQDGLWGVWCAEAPNAQAVIEGSPAAGAVVRLDGSKAWCSGAGTVSHALVSVRDGSQRPWLVAVDMRQAGVRIREGSWQAVGMADTGTAEVAFAGAQASCVGDSGAYLQRPGFWHGGAGIGACWYGAAAELARIMQAANGEPDAHRLAHLGAVDCALSAVRALLRASAMDIDTDPAANAMAPALRVRLAVEAAAGKVMQHAGEALGARPFCMDRHFARLMADLPVFLRQSHARRDEAALGGLAHRQQQGWRL
jgi:hypothetical protein